jgi:cytochrome c oxidase assembly protein subunit 15
LLICALLAVMVLVGGATRLTHSGLSITEWRPVTGIVPPLTDEGWADAFAKYQRIPQFRLRNPEMNLEAFKGIYWWEWVHRLLGRLIGIAFLVPLVCFAARRELSRVLTVRLALIFLLGAAQGALGWYMVKSGLAIRIDVSQYRLAAHLGLAFLIFGFTLWTALGLMPRAQTSLAPIWMRAAAVGILVLVFVQILLGAFVAGLKAGFVYNTWPLMGGRLWPEDYWRLSPWFANWGENAAAVQADHRLGAYLLAISVAAVWVLARKRVSRDVRDALNLLASLIAVQMALGIATLVAVVPLGLALLHQGVALALFASSVSLLHVALLAPKGALAFR